MAFHKDHHLNVFPHMHFICILNGHWCFVRVYLNLHVWCYSFFVSSFFIYSALCVFKVCSGYFVKSNSLLRTVAKYSVVCFHYDGTYIASNSLLSFYEVR